MTTIFREIGDFVSTVRVQLDDFRYLVRAIKGKDFIPSSRFDLNISEQGSFYLNGVLVEWISTNSNPGRILRNLVNDKHFASDESLKRSLMTDDMSVLYKEVNRLKVAFKENGFNIELVRLKNGYEIANIQKASNN